MLGYLRTDIKIGNHESPDWMSNQKTRFKFKSFTTSTTSTGEAFKHWATIVFIKIG